MISQETLENFCKLLLYISERERSIEISRQVLSDLKEYDSFQIFKSIDIESKNKIDTYSLINFLGIKGIYCTEEESSLIILFFDQDYDNTLSYSEFINLIQSEKILKRPLNKFQLKDKIPYNVEYSLIKLLEKEVDLVRNIIYKLKDIKCRYDFNIHNLFHLMKYFNTITNNSLKNFLNKNEISYIESDIKNIIKRLDLNKDGVVDYCEFHAFFGFPDCVYCCPCASCDSCGKCLCDTCYNNIPCYFHGIIPNKDNNKNNYFLNYESEYANTYYKDYEQDNDNSIYNNLNNTNTNNDFINNSNNNNLNKINNKNSKNISKGLSMRISPNKENNIKEDIDIKNQFNNFLLLLMKAETDIEKIKIELAKNQDFNIIDIFLFFDQNNKNFLTKDDLLTTLNSLKLENIDDFIINLLFKRFDLTQKNEINYADFFDMLIPFEKEYRNDVDKRKQKKEILSEDLKEILRKVFNEIIKYEYEINEMRKKFDILIMKLKDIFELFDKDKKGYFDFDEFIKYMNDNKLLEDTSLHADLVFIRFDKNRNGKIIFEELADEIQPLY